MSEKKTILCDVDGVVADLVGGFIQYIFEYNGIKLYKEDFIFHEVSKNTAAEDKFKKYYFSSILMYGEYNSICYNFFVDFMRSDYAYTTHVPVIPGAIDAFKKLKEKYNIIFVTAMMKSAKCNYRDKMEWIEKYFPDTQIITCPSGEKWRVKGDFAIDDRFDLCKNYQLHGTARPFVFKQNWSEIQDNDLSIEIVTGWPEILEKLM